MGKETVAGVPAVESAKPADTTVAGNSPAEIIAAITSKISAEEGTDKDLLAALSKNLLVATPTKSAVEDTLKAIELLAEKRATGAADVKPQA